MTVNDQTGLGQCTTPDNSILDPGLKLVSFFHGVYGNLPPWMNVGRDLLDPAASQLWAWDLHISESKQFTL